MESGLMAHATPDEVADQVAAASDGWQRTREYIARYIAKGAHHDNHHSSAASGAKPLTAEAESLRARLGYHCETSRAQRSIAAIRAEEIAFIQRLARKRGFELSESEITDEQISASRRQRYDVMMINEKY